MRTAGEYVLHLVVSALSALLVYAVASAFADAPWPLVLALVWFAAYWGVWLLVVDTDGSSGGSGGSSSGGFLDSLF